MNLAAVLDPNSVQDIPSLNRVGGKLVACWGSAGAGKSTIAMNLAFEFASLGHKTILIDADSYNPAIAALIGLTNANPGITAVLRLARANRLDVAELGRLTEEVTFLNHTLRVLSGINAPGRWRELDGETLSLLMDFLKGEFDYIVVDLAAGLEPGLYSESSNLSRNHPTRELISLADQVLGIFSSDPVGISRFLWDLREVDFEYLPVANRLRNSVVGRNAERQIKDTLYQLARAQVSNLIPEDGAAIDACQHRAQPLLLAAKSSKTREALRQLALDLLDHPAK